MSELKSKKLNLGCGFDHKPGYINVDLNERHQPDLVGNAIELNLLPSSYFEEIIAQDVLEHVVRDDVRKALFEWNRLLNMGGRIFIRTTELGGILRLLESPLNQSIADQERLIQNLFGTQAYTGDFHLNGFTEKIFRFYMWEAGFEIEELGLVCGAFLDAWAHKVCDVGFPHLAKSTLTDDSWLRAVYAEILDRSPRDDERAADQAFLAEKEHGRLELIRKLLLSEERKQRMIARAPEFPKTLHVTAPLEKPSIPGRIVRKIRHLTNRVLGRGAKSHV